MTRIARSIEIARPVADVFAYVADFANDVAWRANVIEMKPLGNESDALGGRWSRQIEVRKVPGKIVESEAVVIEWERDAVIAVERASGPIRPRATYRFSPAGQGMRLDFELSIALRGASVLAWPLVQLFMLLAIRPAVPKDLQRVKQRLEA
jgi:hypothetical protein